jgi:uncharacterized membrane protein HdeD (DUF308 family)
MNDDFESAGFSGHIRLETTSPTERMAPQWGVVLTVGIVTFVLGVVLAAWPGETVKVVAFLMGVPLVITGGAQIFLALAVGAGPARWAFGLAGAFALVVGVLLLFNPLQTLTFIGWAAGLCVGAVGAADLLGALLSRTARHRGWQAVRGILGLAVGAFLLANPDRSLDLLVVIACVWLISYGSLTIMAALLLRSEHRRAHGVPAADGYQAPPTPA